MGKLWRVAALTPLTTSLHLNLMAIANKTADMKIPFKYFLKLRKAEELPHGKTPLNSSKQGWWEKLFRRHQWHTWCRSSVAELHPRAPPASEPGHASCNAPHPSFVLVPNSGIKLVGKQ